MKLRQLTKTILCAALILSSVLLCCSCTKTEDYTAYGSDAKNKVFYGTDNSGKLVDGSVMTEGMFGYFLSEQKSAFLMTLMYNDTSLSGDSAELWQRKAPDGKTYEEKFFAEVVKSAKELVAANTMLYMMPDAADPNKGYALPQDYVEYVKSLVLNNAVQKHGSVMDFEAYLANFGATVEDYTALYLMTANVDLLKEALFNNQSGSVVFSDDEIRNYYANNYYCAKHIYVNTASDTKIDGTLAPLSPAETAKREGVAAEIEEFMKNGGTVEAAKEIFTQPYVQVYESTAEMDINSSTANAPELGETLGKLEIGETGTAKSAYGIHIIKRVRTEPENFDKNQNTVSSIYSALSNLTYMQILEKQTERVATDSEVLSSFSITEAVLP